METGYGNGDDMPFQAEFTIWLKSKVGNRVYGLQAECGVLP